MRWLGGHVSYANVVATLALFVALGGTSYAALNLPDGSVGSRQIKPGAVSLSKLGFDVGARSASFGTHTVAGFICSDNTSLPGRSLRQCGITAPPLLGTMTITLAHPADVLLLGRAAAFPSQDGQVARLVAYADNAYQAADENNAAATAIPLANSPELEVTSIVKLPAGRHKLHLAVRIGGKGTTELTFPRLIAVVLPPAP